MVGPAPRDGTRALPQRRSRHVPLNGPQLFEELSPAPRLLMGPGPVNVCPGVLSALSMPVRSHETGQYQRSLV